VAWLKLETSLIQGDIDILEARLEELGAVATTLQDAGDHPLLEPAPGETPVWPTVILTALFPDDLNEAHLRGAVSGHLNPDDLHFSHLEEQDWQAKFEHELKPMQFGERLWVIPDDNQSLPANSITLTLPPGLAFGTGQHATTAMCLTWLDSLELSAARVLDYGCGSGILGLAAAALGAGHVCMTDIDPQALDAAQDNAARNDLTRAVQVTPSDKIEKSVRYDILLANILSSTLIELGPVLDGLMRPGARMAITGVLAEQADGVAAAWSGWANMEVTSQINKWVLLTGTKHGIIIDN
jgi:ribosomal protein L11 methyltransferase